MPSLSLVQDTLAELIAFDTTSHYSNLALIDWIEDKLTPLGASFTRIPNAQGDKANLWVRIGPDAPGGIVLSGHTDVVPVDGQNWTTDPFKLTEKDDLLYGRGTSDMKSFLALCLAFAPDFAAASLSRPIHFAFSYDEEIGCKGAPAMIDEIVARGAEPEAVWVGEPTLWQVVSGHKGISLTEVIVTGHEAHSSLPGHGASAIGVAADLMAVVRQIEADLKTQGPEDSPFDPPYPTLNMNVISGGTATNILARTCSFSCDLRCPPGFDVDTILAPLVAAAEAADQRLKARFPDAGVRLDRLSNVPPLNAEPGSPAETLLRALTGDNAQRAVSFAAEAGQFQRAGIPAVICGPGSIDQAHVENEFIDPAQLTQGVEIFGKLLARLS